MGRNSLSPAPSAGPAEEATTSPTTKLPPLASQQLPPLAPSSGSQEGTKPPSPPAPESNPPGQTETARIEPPPTPEPTGPAPRPVTAETLADALPPKAAQANVDLPAAMVGSAYRAELPTFVDPGGKGLRLTASGLPDGLTFSDLGGGKGAIEGVPQQATSASIRIVATNHHDRTAQMSATLVVGDKPAPPPAPVAKLETPTPAPVAEAISRPGLAPTRAPPPSSAAAQVSAPPPSPPTVQAATPAPADQNAAPAASPPPPAPQTLARVENAPPNRPLLRRARILLRLSRPLRRRKRPRRSSRALTEGECFLVEPLPGATKPHEYQAVGRAIEPFRRFDSAYKREVGVEADLTVAPITAEQCPALDLVRLAAPDGRPPPRLALKNYEVGPGQPLHRDDLKSRRASSLSGPRRQRRPRAQAGSEGRRKRRFRNLQRAPDGRREFRRTDADAARDRLGQAHSGSRHASLGEPETHRVAIDRRRAGRVRLRRGGLFQVRQLTKPRCRRKAWGMDRSGADRPQFGRSVWIFLVERLFAAKSPSEAVGFA